MNLLQMSFTGGVLILAVIVLRAMTLNRLPKGTFLALWVVAALRLLAPFSISSPVSVYTLAEHVQVRAEVTEADVPAEVHSMPAVPSAPSAAPAGSAGAVPAEGGPAIDVWPWVWLTGALICGGFFLLSYLRCRREFRTALPVEDAKLRAWLAGRNLRRTVDLCQSDRIHAPLTYGLFRPVILLPRNWKNESRLDCVLEHELAHIRCLDALWKPLFALAACVHWFNPLVWCMFVLANRDMELRCDEAVVRRLGLDSRSGYALTLISLEEKKSGLGPFASAFSKNAVEERIRAIMKIKKQSLAAVIAAVLLVCCITTGFATSAAKEKDISKTPAGDGMKEDNVAYAQKQAQGVLGIMDAMDELLPELTKEEKLWLANQYIADYSGLTVTAFRQKVQMKWNHAGETNGKALDDYVEVQLDTEHPAVTLSGFKGDSGSLPVSSENWSALDHYVELRSNFDHPADALSDFDEYFFNIYLPLIKDGWEDGHGFSGEAKNGLDALEYTCTLRVLNAETLTVGKYQQATADVKSGVQLLLKSGDLLQEDFDELSRLLSTDALSVAVEAGLPLRDYDPEVVDAALHAQFSRESAAEWDRLLAPYVSFGLTYQFYDPDLDGNGLTMWFGGKAVRGIYNEQEHTWLTEHAGPGFSDGAVELYAVYTNGVLSGLREADPDEQEGFDKLREGNGIYAKSFRNSEEAREFPRATREDYDSLETLKTDGYERLSLAAFNQRLLDWANEHQDAWDRINCDVIWNDYEVDQTVFASVSCYFSGIENGAKVRALYTGGPEQAPGFSASLPERTVLEEYEGGSGIAWCDLYYAVSYRIADKSAVTVAERDACVQGMRDAIALFWWDTDFNALLQMTEEDVVAQFNLWAAEYSSANVQINPVTADDIYFEHADERWID